MNWRAVYQIPNIILYILIDNLQTCPLHEWHATLDLLSTGTFMFSIFVNLHLICVFHRNPDAPVPSMFANWQKCLLWKFDSAIFTRTPQIDMTIVKTWRWCRKHLTHIRTQNCKFTRMISVHERLLNLMYWLPMPFNEDINLAYRHCGPKRIFLSRESNMLSYKKVIFAEKTKLSSLNQMWSITREHISIKCQDVLKIRQWANTYSSGKVTVDSFRAGYSINHHKARLIMVSTVIAFYRIHHNFPHISFQWSTIAMCSPIFFLL